MEKIRFRNLSSADFSVSVSQSGTETTLKTTQDAVTTPPSPPPPPSPTPGPTASADTATATAGGADVFLSPLNNDTDPAGAGLTITDASLDAASTAAGASVSIVSNGTQISFTPPASAMTSTISYTVQDINAQPSSSTVEVDVVAPAAGLSVTVTANRTTGTAPAGIFFEATATGFNDNGLPKRELRYLWDFGDPKSPEFDVHDERYDATVNGQGFGWRNSNMAYTYRAAHTFFPRAAEFAGANYKDFTVTCTVRDRDGNQAQGQLVVRINNPDVEFASTTVGVDPSGNYTDLLAEYPNATGYTTMDAAIQAVGKGRVLLKRGGTYTHSIGSFKSRSKFQIGDYGDKKLAKPKIDVINGTGIRIRDGMPEFSVYSVHLEGDWDVTTESSPTGTTKNGSMFVWDNVWNTAYDTIHDVDCTKVNDIAFLCSGKWEGQWDHKVVLSNVKIRDFRNYGVLFGISKGLALVGVSILDNPLKMQGGRGKDAGAHEHMPVRVAMPFAGYPNIFDAYQAQSWAGWSLNPAYEYNNVPAPQACWRFNPGDADNDPANQFREPADYNASRFMLEGGNTSFLHTRQDQYSPGSMTGIIDKGIIICGPTSISAQTANDYGVTVTNLLCIAPKMNITRVTDFGSMVGGVGKTPNQLTFRGITMLNWIDPIANRHESGSGPVDFDEWEPGKNYGKYSSLFHYPNGMSPNDLSAQLNLTFRLFAPRHPGLRFIDQFNYNGKGAGATIIDTSYAAQDTFNQYGAPNDQASVVMPVPISGQLTTTKADAPIDDIFGNVRPATPHRGCVEPSSVA